MYLMICVDCAEWAENHFAVSLM